MIHHAEHHENLPSGSHERVQMSVNNRIPLSLVLSPAFELLRVPSRRKSSFSLPLTTKSEGNEFAEFRHGILLGLHKILISHDQTEEIGMNTLQDRFDEASPPRIGAGELESGGANSNRIQVRLADKLHQAAETLFGKTEDTSTPPDAANLGSQARDWLHHSADYIAQVEPEKIKADLTAQMRRNPGKSLLVAGAAGLILGAIFRRK